MDAKIQKNPKTPNISRVFLPFRRLNAKLPQRKCWERLACLLILTVITFNS